MKIFYNNKLYLEQEDITVEPINDFIYMILNMANNISGFIEITEPNLIEYYNSKEYILDYNDVKRLSNEDLERLVNKTITLLKSASTIFLSKEFYQEQPYDYAIVVLRRMFESIDKYKNNRHDYTIRTHEIYLKNEKELQLKEKLTE